MMEIKFKLKIKLFYLTQNYIIKCGRNLKLNLINMKVSVVTPNYNGVKFLKNYFDSLNEDQEYIGEVIIVDNGSVDNSVDYIKNNSFNFPIKLIENKENLGFAPAVNQAITEARYEYIFH